MLIIFILSFLARADKRSTSKPKSNIDRIQDFKGAKNKKHENLVNTTNSNVDGQYNYKRKARNNRKKNQFGDQDSMKEIADNLQKLRDGVEIYKAVNRNYYQQDDQQKTNQQKNKMFDILNQIRERYAPPTTPISHVTFTSIFITFLVIALIFVVAYFMISRFFKIKSSEVNEEELPLIIGQLTQDQHDLSVHGFSKI